MLLAADPQPTGGFNPMLIILIVLFALMIFMMFRNKKKAAAAQEEKKAQLVPGAEIMTTAGIYGTVLSVNTETNRVEVQVAPGQVITFDVRAISQFVTAADEAPSESPADAAAAENQGNESRLDLRKDEGESGPATSA